MIDVAKKAKGYNDYDVTDFDYKKTDRFERQVLEVQNSLSSIQKERGYLTLGSIEMRFRHDKSISSNLLPILEELRALNRIHWSDDPFKNVGITRIEITPNKEAVKLEKVVEKFGGGR